MSIEDSLALKYRPKKLSDVIGQPTVVKAFTNAFKSKTLHHAYILSGNFGCGKTTVARIVAATENCKKGGKDPCGECSNCKAIFEGKSLEVREMDAGSGGKVDDIRELHKSLYQYPVECNTKYVIIDEAHSLTGQAAEASLKMIEEPPKYVRFILCIDENQILYDKNHRHVRIKDIKEGDSILTENGFSKVKNKFYKGKSIVYDLRTEGGSILRLTNSHKVRVFDGDSIVWKKASDITDKDYLPIFHSHYDDVNYKNDLCDLTPDECEFLGRMVGDGYYTYKRLGLLFSKKELDDGKNLLNKLEYSYREYNKGECSEIKIYNKNSFIKKRFQLEDYEAGHKTLPSIVYKFNKLQMSSFLYGLIGADGHVDKKGYKRLYSNNLLLLSQLKAVLISYGYHTSLVQSNRVFKEDSKTTGIKKGEYISYTMLFLEREPRIRISENLRLGLIEKYKSCKDLRKTVGIDKRYHLSRKMLDSIDSTDLQYLKKDCCFERFHSLTLAEESIVYDLEMDNESHSFITNGFSVHNCTTEPQAFKPTIHSRCILWGFNKVAWPELFEHLKMVAAKEGLTCDERALQIAAKQSQGSVRNCLQNLQTIMNFTGNKIVTVDDAREALSVIDDTLYFNLMDAILSGNMVNSFLTINKLFRDGKEAKIVIDGLYEHLNNLLVVRTCGNDLDKFDFTPEEIKKYQHQNGPPNSGPVILQMMNYVGHISFDIEYSLNPAQSFNKFAVESIQLVRSKKVKQPTG